MDFEESVAALTAKEATKIELALNDLDDRLFVPVPDKKPEEIVEIEEHDVYRDYMQSAGVGYSAHTEEVTDEEISMWQSKFKYLQVKGDGMLELDPAYEEVNKDEDILEGVYFHSMSSENQAVEEKMSDSVSENTPDLRVTGVAMPLVSGPLSGHEKSDNSTSEQGQVLEVEEVLFTEGHLEETLCINRGPIISSPSFESEGGDDIYTSIEPMYCQQAEIINSLVDVIFPDIVKLALQPVAARVVQVGREHNVRFVAEEELRHDEYGLEDGHGDEPLFLSGDSDNDYNIDDNNFNDTADNERGGRGFLVVPDGWD